MRTLITVVLLLLISQLVAAQKNFEGKITYFLHYSDSSIIDGIYPAYFSVNKLRIKDTIFSNNRIYHFYDNTIYFVSTKGKTKFKERMTDYIFDTLFSWIAISGLKKNISGYDCSGYKISVKNNPYYDDTTNGLKFLYWFADSLFFNIPLKYKKVLGLVPICNGEKINLGIDISQKKGNVIQKTGFVYGIVEPGKVPDSIFIEPTYLTVDNAQKRGRMKRLKRINGTDKKYHSKNTHNQPTKSPAIKQKE